MYIITDCTSAPPKRMEVNDGKDVTDIILGITGREDIAQNALRDIWDMNVGATMIGNPYYIIDCVK